MTTGQLDDTRFLYWAKPELELLQKHYQSEGDSHAASEIEVGLRFIQTEWAQTHAALKSLLPYLITFEYLWTIFPSDCLVVGKDDLNNTNIWRVRAAKEFRTTKETFFGISAERMEWDGKRMAMVVELIRIDHFFGSLALEDLSYMPLKYHPKAASIVKYILDRSDRKLAYCQRGYKVREHEGLGLTVEMTSEKKPKSVKHHVSRADFCLRFQRPNHG